MAIYAMQARFDKSQSFYGKAMIDECSDKGKTVMTLFSYGVPVAIFDVDAKKFSLLEKWNFSQTTRRHVRGFARQNDVEDQYEKAKKEWGNDED